VLGVFAGHVHITTEAVRYGIPVYTLRSTAFQFARRDLPELVLEAPHYRWVTIRDGILSSRIFEVSL
jgi:hypothetical protein